MRDDTIDLRTEWLDDDCERLSSVILGWPEENLQDLHFRPIGVSASSTDSAWYRVVLVVEANDCVST